MNIAGILKRLDALERESAPSDIPPLFIRSSDHDEILGFQCGEDTVMRNKGESIDDLEARVCAKLKKGRATLLSVAITQRWKNWPYMPDLSEEEWAEAAMDHYQKNEDEK